MSIPDYPSRVERFLSNIWERLRFYFSIPREAECSALSTVSQIEGSRLTGASNLLSPGTLHGKIGRL